LAHARAHAFLKAPAAQQQIRHEAEESPVDLG
jgi:hypothetical protein